MQNMRPKNLNLLSISFPVTAIISIMHRVTGFVLIVMLPFLLAILHYSLSSPAAFDELSMLVHSGWGKLVLLLLLMPFSYHFIAGMRHLMMDLHWGESKAGGRASAKMVIGLFVLSMVLLWWCLC